jgi:hypothetical protein
MAVGLDWIGLGSTQPIHNRCEWSFWLAIPNLEMEVWSEKCKKFEVKEEWKLFIYIYKYKLIIINFFNLRFFLMTQCPEFYWACFRNQACNLHFKDDLEYVEYMA